MLWALFCTATCLSSNGMIYNDRHTTLTSVSDCFSLSVTSSGLTDCRSSVAYWHNHPHLRDRLGSPPDQQHMILRKQLAKVFNLSHHSDQSLREMIRSTDKDAIENIWTLAGSKICQCAFLTALSKSYLQPFKKSWLDWVPLLWPPFPGWAALHQTPLRGHRFMQPSATRRSRRHRGSRGLQADRAGE
jgi:hypothetical protein